MAPRKLSSSLIMAMSLLLVPVTCIFQNQDPPNNLFLGRDLLSVSHSNNEARDIKGSMTEKNLPNSPREKFGSIPYGIGIRHCTQPGVIALTFDDGPSELTNELLDVLESKQVHATFFINGNNNGIITDPSTGSPAILRRILDAGHQIGSHGWSHKDLNKLGPEERREEIIQNEMALAEILGDIPTYFRPPYGSCDEECSRLLGELGYHVILWNIDTNDWKGDIQASKNSYTQAVASGSSESWVVLAHDTHQATVHQLAAYMIDTAKNTGYKLGTLGECLGDPKENWYRDSSTGGRWSMGIGSEISSPAASQEVTTSTPTLTGPAQSFRTQGPSLTLNQSEPSAEPTSPPAAPSWVNNSRLVAPVSLLLVLVPVSIILFNWVLD